MKNKEQRSKLIQGLQDYLDNTSPEQLEKDWKELEKFNQYGPDMEECLKLGRQHCMEKNRLQDYWQDVRERAAIAAMQGMLANPELMETIEWNGRDYRWNIEKRAILYADALIEELKKK